MPPHPFRFQAPTPLGPLRVCACPGRTATVVSGDGEAAGFHLERNGRRFALRARAVRIRGAWALRDVAILGESPLLAPSAPEVVELIMAPLATALDANMRRFVERDVVEVLRERDAERGEIERVRGEIARRRGKVRALVRASKTAEAGRGAREASLRGELAALTAAASGA